MYKVYIVCSGGRTRTYNQLLTRQSHIAVGVDYIIIRSGCEALRPVDHRTTPVKG